MSVSKVTFLLAGVLLLVGIATPNLAQTGDIVITGADVVQMSSTALDQNLALLTAGIKSRIVLNYANVLQHIPLTPLTGSLQLSLGKVSPRIVLNYAQINHRVALSYPSALINDAVPPQVKKVAIGPFSHNAITLIWTTDEYATGAVAYGWQSGNYTRTISNILYLKTHQITLSNLTSGATYYYQIESVNRNGVSFLSEEKRFRATNTIYLPILLKGNVV